MDEGAEPTRPQCKTSGMPAPDTGVRSQVARPVLYQGTPSLEQLHAPIGRLAQVPQPVRQLRLDDFRGMIRLLFH